MKKNYPNVDTLKNINNVVSSTDFTGIVQGSGEEGELNKCDSLYHFPEQGGINTNKPELINKIADGEDCLCPHDHN